VRHYTTLLKDYISYILSWGAQFPNFSNPKPCNITIFENDTIAIDIMEADYDSCLHYVKTITWIYKDGMFVTTAKMVEDITDALMVLFKP
jgi:hypothetical protein